MLDIEAAPGDLGQVFLCHPEDNVLLHTNHFISPRADVTDAVGQAMPGSPFRLERLRQLVAESQEPFDPDSLAALLSDHDSFPFGICAHVNPKRQHDSPPAKTVVTVILEPSTRTLWVADGNPCEVPLQRFDLAAALA